MIVTSSERHAVQRFFETKLGCEDLTQWKSYKPALRGYILTTSDAVVLDPLLKQDALALYIKALQTFTQALAGLQRKEFAWPIVKMYYSVFYAMRCELHASSVIAVKNGDIFYMPNVPGTAFSSIQEKGSHQTYIKLRKTMPASVIAHDEMLDNEIESGVDVYSWMCNNRERVNYRAKHFTDPEPDSVLQKIHDNYLLTHRLTDLFSLYDEDMLYCFDKDHTTIAVPYRKLLSCKSLLSGQVAISTDEHNKLDSVRTQLISTGLKTMQVDKLMV